MCEHQQQQKVKSSIDIVWRTINVMQFIALLLLIPLSGMITGANGFAHGFEKVRVPHHAQPATSSTALSASGFLDNIPVADSPDVTFGFDATSSAISSSEVWALRIGSGLLTYFGFVFATDRPRGQLGVSLVGGESGSDNAINADGYIRVAPSTVPGAGLGLFAARSMPRGTVLGTYPGVILPLAQHSASSKVQKSPGCASYIWRFTDNKYVIDPTDHNDGTLGALCRGGNPSQPLSVFFFDVLSLLGLWKGVSTALCRINEPPKGRDVNVVTEENLETRTVTFALERDVFEGEELHIDYGLTYDRSGYGNIGGGGNDTI